MTKLYGMGQDSSTVDLSYFGDAGGAVAPGGSFDWGKLFDAIDKGAITGVQLYKSLQPPTLVAGTQAIYNQATGQFYNPTTGQVVNPAGATALTSPVIGTSVWVVGGLVLAGILAISLVGGRR
jgi:hypothetical protein